MEDDTIRLAKLMAQRGVASRRASEQMISEGRVTVNGEVAVTPCLVNPETDRIRIGRRALPPEPERLYLLLYKPRGYITGRNDPRGRKSVLDLVEDYDVRVEPVGRLDFDTEGALLLTNDGELAHQLSHPSSRIPKRYLAKVYRCPAPDKLQAIERGRVRLEDGNAAPAKVRVLEQTDRENSWLEITVTEGRNRLIRRLFSQLRHPVSKLRRESFATLSIRGMERGEVRRLTHDEVRRVKDLARGVKPSKAGRVRRRKGFAVAKPKTRRSRRVKPTKRGRRG